MRSFLVWLVGVIVGAIAALFAVNVSPTKEAISPILERFFPVDIPALPLTANDLATGHSRFTADQLIPLGIEPCFPRAEAREIKERPWLERDLADRNMEGTELDPFPDLADYPGLIKIEGIRSTLGTRREHCAAVRVAQHWFLTAAHCITDLDIETTRPTYDVIAVTPDVNVRSQNIQVLSVHGAVCHSAYGMNRQQYPNDIALFYLDDVSAFADVAIAKLETQATGLLPRDLSDVYISGWGRNGGTQFLQGGPVRITEPGEAVLIGDKIGARGPNVGDSGAPLYANTPNGPIVVGILSQVTQDTVLNGDRSIYVRSKAVNEWVNMTMAVCEQDGEYLCSEPISTEAADAPVTDPA